MTRAAFILALVVSIASICVAQESPSGAPPFAPGLVISQARAAYRAGPLADSMTVRLTTANKRTRSASLLLRLDAHTPDAPPAFRLEFDSLIISAAPGSLAAAHTDNENDRWLIAEAGPDLASLLAHLPPLPVPQLHLAFDPSTGFDEPTPYTSGVVWDSSESVPASALSNHAEVRLKGRSSSGAIQVSFDAVTFRLRSLHAELAGGLLLDISAESADPGDPASWPINTTGRRIVADLSDLAPQRGPIAPGDYLPDLSFTQADELTRWDLHTALAVLPPASPDGAPPAVALIVFRLPDDPTELAAAEASARLALRAVQLDAAVATLDTHIAAAIDLKSYGDQWPALKQRWGTDSALAGIPGWTTPSSIIDRFDHTSRAILILVAPDRRLLAAIALDSQTDAEPLAADIRRALSIP